MSIRARGHIEAESGFFKGRIEAEEGFFRGLLETPALRSSTETLYASQRNYTAGTSVRTILQQEASIWGETGNLVWDLNTPVSGTYNGISLSRIAFHYYVRGLDTANYIYLTFSDGTSACSHNVRE